MENEVIDLETYRVGKGVDAIIEAWRLINEFYDVNSEDTYETE